MDPFRCSLVAVLLLIVPACAPQVGAERTEAAPALEIVCTDTGTAIAQATVEAREEGVLVRARNRAAAERLIVLERTGSWRLRPGDTFEWSVPLTPGTAHVGCFPDRGGQIDPGRYLDVLVGDPEGLWRIAPPLTNCASGWVFQSSYPAPGAPGEEGWPSELARRSLQQGGWWRPGDEVFDAGYPRQPNGHAWMEREGVVVAVFEYEAAGPGWTPLNEKRCRDL